jgi:hypothetical protein
VNRQRSRKETSSEVDVGLDARLCDYAVGEDEGYREPHNTLFRGRIKNIQHVAGQRGVSPGELLLMINKNNGWVWDTIPWGKFDEIVQTICTFTQSLGSFGAYQIINRDYFLGVREEERRMMGMTDNQCVREIIQKLDRVGNIPTQVEVTDGEAGDGLPF